MDTSGNRGRFGRISNNQLKKQAAAEHNAERDKRGDRGVEGPQIAVGPFQGNRAGHRAALYGRGGKKTSRSRPIKQMKGGSGRGIDKIHALIQRGLDR